MKLKDYTKKELVEIASIYNTMLPKSMKKGAMISHVRELLDQQIEMEGVPMSVRIRRIKESGN